MCIVMTKVTYMAFVTRNPEVCTDAHIKHSTSLWRSPNQPVCFSHIGHFPRDIDIYVVYLRQMASYLCLGKTGIFPFNLCVFPFGLCIILVCKQTPTLSCGLKETVHNMYSYLRTMLNLNTFLLSDILE